MDEANEMLSPEVASRLRAATQILARGAVRAADAEARASDGTDGPVEDDCDGNQTSGDSDIANAA